MALKECCKEPVLGSRLALRDPDGGASVFNMELDAAHVAVARVYKIDGCQIVAGMRCDYLLFPNPDAAVFVELKGCDVEKGFAQLEAAIKILSKDVNGRRRYAVLVPTRCPLPPYQTAKAQDHFRKALGCKLKIKNRKCDCRSVDY